MHRFLREAAALPRGGRPSNLPSVAPKAQEPLQHEVRCMSGPNPLYLIPTGKNPLTHGEEMKTEVVLSQ